MKPQSPYPITTTVVLLLLLIHFQYAAAAATPSPQPSPPSLCSDELVKFSVCLSFVSSPPNNLTNLSSSDCCDDYESVFSAGNGICLCYLIMEPPILGFPIDSSRLVSLTSLCSIDNIASTANFSLDSLCSGSSTLPPLHSIQGPGRSGSRSQSQTQNSSHNISSPPMMSSPEASIDDSFAPAPADHSPTHPGSNDSPSHPGLMTPSSSSATMKINYRCVLPGIVVFLVHGII